MKQIMLNQNKIKEMKIVEHPEIIHISGSRTKQYQFVMYRGTITWPASYMDSKGVFHSDHAVPVNALGFRLESVMRIPGVFTETILEKDYGIITAEQRHLNALAGILLRMKSYQLNDTAFNMIIMDEIKSWYLEPNRWNNPFGRQAERNLKAAVEELRRQQPVIEQPKKKNVVGRLLDLLNQDNDKGVGM